MSVVVVSERKVKQWRACSAREWPANQMDKSRMRSVRFGAADEEIMLRLWAGLKSVLIFVVVVAAAAAVAAGALV
jgi:hypothetical protein